MIRKNSFEVCESVFRAKSILKQILVSCRNVLFVYNYICSEVFFCLFFPQHFLPNSLFFQSTIFVTATLFYYTTQCICVLIFFFSEIETLFFYTNLTSVSLIIIFLSIIIWTRIYIKQIRFLIPIVCG